MEFFDILKQLADKIISNTICNIDESGYSTVQKRKQKIIANTVKDRLGESLVEKEECLLRCAA